MSLGAMYNHAIMYREMLEKLSEIIGRQIADAIDKEIRAEANQYTIIQAIDRLNIIRDMAAHGIRSEALLKMAKNHSEEKTYWDITCGFATPESINATMEEQK